MRLITRKYGICMSVLNVVMKVTTILLAFHKDRQKWVRLQDPLSPSVQGGAGPQDYSEWPRVRSRKSKDMSTNTLGMNSRMHVAIV